MTLYGYARVSTTDQDLSVVGQFEIRKFYAREAGFAASTGSDYLRAMADGYEISIRSRGGLGKAQRYAWSVYAPDGEEVASGEEAGADKYARAAAEHAKNQHYMKTRRSK